MSTSVDHQIFHERLAKSGVDKAQKSALWKVMKADGLDAGLKAMAEIVVPEPEFLRDQPVSYRTWGKDGIEPGAVDQMNNAMRLPISVAGALMPDAHVGYGLPIGGVLATDNTVIPYAVGVDIACRLRLSVTSLDASMMAQPAYRNHLNRMILENTRFGIGCNWDDRLAEDPMLDSPNWAALPTELRGLKDTARSQLGTSGGGNHFVEFGVFEESADVRIPGLDRLDERIPTRYVALLSHSGSRGVGAKIADYYSKLAMRLHPTLPDEAKHLSWLDLDKEEGQAYWTAMMLAAEFAGANHRIIHERVLANVAPLRLLEVENVHNLAWKQTVTLPDGNILENAIVHRKGATPAAKGLRGIIPGTMGESGYLVEGLGNSESLESSSHGAGRQMGRNQAKRMITPLEMKSWLDSRQVMLTGGGVDEAPQAYKRIDEVMAAQVDLVKVLGSFTPRIVRMASDGFSED